MRDRFKETLNELLQGLSISVEPRHLSKFDLYCQTLTKNNAKLNLTAIKNENSIASELFADSLFALNLKCVKERGDDNPFCIDVGTGAGFPGLVLKIARPSWKFTLLESNGKKCAFLQHMIQKLALPSVRTACERAEVFAREHSEREKYDLVFCRAVSSFATVLELTLPFVTAGGMAVLYRGHSAQLEIQETSKVVNLLGGRLSELAPYRIKGMDKTRYLTVIEKVYPTPPAYPRRTGMPSKKPLGLTQ